MLNHEVDQWDLSGQVALVTGGTRGLGQAFAQGLSDAGALVVITGRSVDRVEATHRPVLRACDIERSPRS